MAQKKFGGRLDEPMPELQIEMFLSRDDAIETTQWYLGLEQLKLDQLLMHYGVTNFDYKALALAMARDFVPGFQAKKRRGRPRKWNPWTHGVLYAEISRKIREHVLPADAIGDAAKMLSEQLRWSKFISHVQGSGIDADPAETLRKAYYAAQKDKFTPMIFDLYQHFEHEGTMNEWEKFVDDVLTQSLVLE